MRKPKSDAIALAERIERGERIFRAVLADSTIDAIAADYIERRLRIAVTPAQRTMVASEFGHACRDFLIKDTRDVGTEYRGNAEVLEHALRILQADPDHFGSLMVSGDGGAGMRRALESIAQVAADLKRIAVTHERDARNKSFFYVLGRRWAGAKLDDADLPLPTPSQALRIFDALVTAIKAESDTLLQGMKTDYSADPDGASEIRKLMNAGRRGGSNQAKK